MVNNKVNTKFMFFIIIFLSIWLIYNNWQFIVSLLEKEPFLWSIYSFVRLQIEEKSLIGLAILTFFGSLFFIFVPLDIVFIYYFSLDYNRFIVAAIIIGFALLGLIFDYVIGLLLGQKIFKDRYQNLQGILEKFGTFILIIGYLIYLPVQFISASLGVFKYPLKKFLLITFIMLIVKTIIIFILGDYILSEVIPRILAFF